MSRRGSDLFVVGGEWNSEKEQGSRCFFQEETETLKMKEYVCPKCQYSDTWRHNRQTTVSVNIAGKPPKLLTLRGMLIQALLSGFMQIAASPSGVGVKRPSTDDPSLNSESRKRHASGTGTSIMPTVIPKAEPGSSEPIERAHADTVLNFLLRLACQVSWHHCAS
jgi:hypothetical protein